MHVSVGKRIKDIHFCLRGWSFFMGGSGVEEKVVGYEKFNLCFCGVWKILPLFLWGMKNFTALVGYEKFYLLFGVWKLFQTFSHKKVIGVKIIYSILLSKYFCIPIIPRFPGFNYVIIPIIPRFPDFNYVISPVFLQFWIPVSRICNKWVKLQNI